MESRRHCTKKRISTKNQFQFYRCALKLVPILFTKAELANSNTDGSHKKGSLDSGRLNSLKTLIFTQFPVTSNEEKEKIWSTPG